MEMTLSDLLPYIDEYQFIKIECRGNILYKGQRRYFVTSDIHSKIRIMNILYVRDDNEVVPSITICVRDYFG